MTHIVYKASAKALSKKVLNAEDRIVLLSDGSAMLYRGDELIQSDLLYRRKDSHLEATTEAVPIELKASQHEIKHVTEHKIVLPSKLIRHEIST